MDWSGIGVATIAVVDILIPLTGKVWLNMAIVSGGIEFEWDVSKEIGNVAKHAVTFLEAMETFFDPNGIQMTDVTHSIQEGRYYWIGKTRAGRILTTRFTRRDDKVRIIGSAEWRKFRRLYETAQTGKS